MSLRERLLLSTHPFPPVFLYLHTNVLLVLLGSYEQDEILLGPHRGAIQKKTGEGVGKRENPFDSDGS